MFAGAILATLSPMVSDAQWQWPAPGPRNGAISPWWSVTGAEVASGDDQREYRFMAPGTVLYHDTESRRTSGAHTVPRGGDLVVVQHGNGLWTFYSGRNLRLPETSGFSSEGVGTDSRFYADGEMSFAVFDAAQGTFVNTRAILPEEETVPDDGLPVVGFIQDGTLTRSRNLTPGEADFVVPQQWLDPATLPRRIYVLIDGLLKAEIDFTVPEDVAQRVTPGGHLLLLSLSLEPGPVLVEVESHQFDGSVEHRTIPVRVPEPVALDTP